MNFREAKFQNFPGSIPPDLPTILPPKGLHTILAGPTLNFFRRDCYYQCVKLSIILRILRRQKDASFLSRKRCTFRIIQRYILYFKDCWHEVRSSLKCTPRRKSCVRACLSYGRALQLLSDIKIIACGVFAFFSLSFHKDSHRGVIHDTAS